MPFAAWIIDENTVEDITTINNGVRPDMEHCTAELHFFVWGFGVDADMVPDIMHENTFLNEWKYISTYQGTQSIVEKAD